VPPSTGLDGPGPDNCAQLGDRRMIKLCFCGHRLPTLTREQFQDYWHANHAPLLERHAEVLGTEEAQAAVAELNEDEHRFADLSRSPIFLAEERQVL